MPATDSELTSMEDPHVLEDEEGTSTNIPSSVPPAAVPSSAPCVPTTTKPNFTSETVIETKAVSMASNDCSSALSSPAEASPAKPAVTSPTTFDGTVETSPATSHIASASDSLTCTGMSLVNISESPPLVPEVPSITFGSPDLQTNFPSVLTFKGVSVTLENNSVWKQFYSCGTEMILTKQGRRMFPYCRYRLAGLDPERRYSLVLSIVPSDQYRYRWSPSKWEVTGPAENQAQGLIRAFSHHYSPCRGSEWMGGLVSFYKLKLTNNPQDQDGHIILHSMHRYIPRLHVIPVPDGDAPTPDKPVVMGPESMTFTFPQTEFMAVTTYQNFRITQLKINHNPFAKGFRDDGHNSRLNRPQPVLKSNTLLSALKPNETDKNKQEVVDLSTKNHNISLSNEQETRLVLKPIMSTIASKDELYVPCLRGKHALGELVLVQKRPCVEASEEAHAVSVTPKEQQDFSITPKAISSTPTSLTSTPASSPGYRKRRKRINRHWANSRGREWKAATASPAAVHSPSLTVAMQPELDDVEGLLFVSFTSKEALEVHVRDKPASNSSSATPVTTQMQFPQKMEATPETDEEKITRLEALLLQDLRVFKHRQTIHPVLQEVGLKLSSLDPAKSIDLQYLGIHLPLPLPNLPEQDSVTSPGDEGLPFISRTGKTSDMTKIKGWRNKFIRTKETSPICDGSQKNLSAFCSNMLDEYLESEARYISERADAFSTGPEDSVAYQLPAKSSSYVKTLDSVLKHRSAASKFPVGPNRPCPLSHKPLLYSVLTSSNPPLASRATPCQAEAQSIQQSASPHAQPGAVLMANAASGSNSYSSVSNALSTHHPGTSQSSAASFGQSQRMTHRPPGFTKFQYKLLLMEMEALNEGLSRTQLTPDRLSVALSVMLTKQMQPSQVLKVPQYVECKAEGPECGQDFCRLGCVCSSLQHLNRGPLHCRRPECMFGCSCFKRKITKQLTVGETEQQIQPVYFMTYMEHVVQPRPGSHANKLWNRSIDDPDPLFSPRTAPQCLVPVKAVKSSSAPRPMQMKSLQIREEDKSSVYRYFESMMTCARVRAFKSEPPPEVTIDCKIPDTSTPNTTAKLHQRTTDSPKIYHRTILTLKKAGQTSQGSTSEETEARKQIEIQSACQWDKDRKKVLEALCRRMNQNKLSQRFCIGPYHIRPVAKIFMKKPSGSIVTYRLHISKPSEASDDDEDESDDSDEEMHADNSLDGDGDAEEEDGQIEEPEMRFGVTPFLSGVLPAGKLRARTRPVGCQASGLIQVNGKSYNQARLLLGNMGCLHPANRLAAYITGRLHAPADISRKASEKSDPTNKTSTLGALLAMAAGKVVPPIITAKKTAELKTPAQPPVQQSKPDSWRKASITTPQHSQNALTINPFHAFVLGQRSSVNPFQHSSMSSPVSLTVSPSLKTPSFLGKSGTYSFRIFPPANQLTRDQKLPGVTLPGGFTLIELPKPGADGAAPQSESVSNTNTARVDKAPALKDALCSFGHIAADSKANLLSVDTCTGAKDTCTGAKDLLSSRSVEPGSSHELMCDEKMPSDESDEVSCKQEDSNLDLPTEYSSSDTSDYCGEGDEDEEVVDIETVEEVRQGMAIAQMKEAVRKALQESRDSSDDFASSRELSVPNHTVDEHVEPESKRRRENHTWLERRRRSEQRVLFDKLQSVLQSDPRAPRLRLLSLALKEIQNLVETSRYLEEKKRRLTRLQSVYVKELSLLSGKSDTLIKQKLTQICDRQKTRESFVYSHLLHCRAAALQIAAPQSKLQPTPLLQPHFFIAPANPHTTADQSSVDLTPTPPSLLLSVSSPAQAELTAPLLLAENQPGDPGAPAQDSITKSQTECKPTTPEVTAAQDSTSPISSTPSSNSVQLSQRFTLPLIRSKTGRIILPSSLKPTGQGFYTLMVVNTKQKGQDGEASMQPSDVDLSKNQEKSFSKSDHTLDSEISLISEEDTTVQSSNSEPKGSGVTAPLAELALLNKSMFGPSVALLAAENSQEGGAVVSLNKTLAAASLSLNPVHQVPTHVEPEPDPSPPVVRRGRGRPRKNSVTPVRQSGKCTVVEDTSKSVISLVVEKRQSEKMASEVVKDTPGVVSDSPVPVKRARGRPRKNKSAKLCSPPAMQARRSSSKSNEDSPAKLYHNSKSRDIKLKESPAATTLFGDVNTSRPLTRGALGKDFPSAKKRSWIDIEKELDPELESE